MSTEQSRQWRSTREYHAEPSLYAPVPTRPQPSSPIPDRYYHDASPYRESPYQPPKNARPAPDYYGYQQDPFIDEASIPLHPQDMNRHSLPKTTQIHPDTTYPPNQPYTSKPKPHRFLSFKTPWVTYILTLAQTTVFIYTLIHTYTLTGSPIEIHPSFNPMIGPSPYILINTGGRYIPCMRAESGVQDATEPIYWPCPNTTTSTASCTLAELCGFHGANVPNPVVDGSVTATPAPNQWWRFITPIFIHAGVVHIGFNMLLQLLIARETEIQIGHLRFTLIYFASGIFGFILGGNFAGNGIVSTGASGALFGIIALLLLDLFYTWRTRRTPVKDLIFLLIDVVVSFVLGLLPGIDNFSHIGGFVMGLALGVCVLRSPETLRRERQRQQQDSGLVTYSGGSLADEPSPHKSSSTALRSREGPMRCEIRDVTPAYALFTLVRLLALAAAITCTVLLIKAFYTHHGTECSWCKYLSCLPVKDWCEVGQLSFTNTTSSRL